MAEVDGLRTKDLPDEQASYDKELFLPVETTSFTQTKKMKVGTIYPKTFELSALGNFNPTSTLLRADTGTGEEKKVTVKAMLEDSDVVALLKTALNINVSSISFSGTTGTGLAIVLLEGNRLGKVQFITGKITNTEWGTEIYLKTIVGYSSPGFEVYFPSNPTTTDSQGWGRIATNGNIYLTPYRDDEIWHFNVTIIGS